MKPNEARPGSLELVANCSSAWRYMAKPGETIDDVQRPDFWRNNTREAGQQRVGNLHAWNSIEVIAEDGTWECTLRVVSVADGLVQTRLLTHWKTPAKPGRKPSAPDGYKIEHLEGNGWRALDTHGAIIASRESTEEEATRKAAAHATQAKRIPVEVD